jgi:hypothetical protein
MPGNFEKDKKVGRVVNFLLLWLPFKDNVLFMQDKNPLVSG